MKKSEIVFSVELDEQNVPEKMFWNASDKEDDGLSETKSIFIGLWDHFNKNTPTISLWTKDMPVDEMKRFCIDALGGIGQAILTSTGDEFMANEVNALCDKFVKHIQEEQKNTK